MSTSFLNSSSDLSEVSSNETFIVSDDSNSSYSSTSTSDNDTSDNEDTSVHMTYTAKLFNNSNETGIGSETGIVESNAIAMASSNESNRDDVSHSYIHSNHYATPPMPPPQAIYGTGSGGRRQSHYDVHSSVCSSLLYKLQGDVHTNTNPRASFHTSTPIKYVNSPSPSPAPSLSLSPSPHLTASPEYSVPVSSHVTGQIQLDHQQHMYAMINVKCAELTAQEKNSQKEIKKLQEAAKR